MDETFDVRFCWCGRYVYQKLWICWLERGFYKNTCFLLFSWYCSYQHFAARWVFLTA